MKTIGCWFTCEGWDDDDHGLGCYGWCKIRDIPITWQEVYGEYGCAQRKDKIAEDSPQEVEK